MSKPGSLIKLAHYVDGKIEFFESQTDTTAYIAISHVWGEAEWRQVNGVPQEILVSEKKATFIEGRLSTIVEGMPFWMDILSINQRGREEVIAATKAIPEIFRNAAWTLAVREGDGLYDCCTKAMEAFEDWEELQTRMHEHAWVHLFDLNTEAYLQRLWTLQECQLSHTIKFVTIGSGKEALATAEEKNMLRTSRRSG